MLSLIKRVLTIIVIAFLLIFIIGIIGDPALFFRKGSFFSIESEFLYPGLIRNYDFDTVITGTSLVQDILPSQVDSLVSNKTINFAISGSSIHEQIILLNWIIKNKKVKNIIWEIRPTNLFGNPYQIQKKQFDFPRYLYNENNIFTVLKLLSEPYVIQQSIKKIVFKNKNLFKIENNYDYFQYNKIIERKFGKEVVLKKLKRKEINQTTDFDINNANINVENILSFIEQNKNIKFYVFIPPIPTLNLSLLKSTSFKNYELYMTVKYDCLIEKLKKIPNVSFFDFQDDFQVTDNLDNYRDLLHFNKSTSAYIIDQIFSSKETNKDTSKEIFDNHINEYIEQNQDLFSILEN